MNKPWEMPQPDEDIVHIWETCATREFYFATMISKVFNKTLVFVVPADFFNEEALMYSYSMPIANIIPGYLEEISPAIYESRVNERVVSLDMLERGFIRDDKFQTFIDKTGYPYKE